MMGLRFSLFGIPVAIQPFFVIMAWIVFPQDNFKFTLMWIACVFVGVLAHELGHAFVARHFGFQPVIILHSFGGVTSWRSERQLGYGQRIILSAAGPAVGICIGVLALGALVFYGPVESAVLAKLFEFTIWVNLGWGVLNLFPVLPLDGGHIATAAAEAVFGPKGRTVALVVSLVITGVLAMWMMWKGQIWMTIIMVILSISNFQALGLFKKKAPAPAGAAMPSDADAERAYSMARSMVLSGDQGEALTWLETAIYAGFNDAARLDYDEAWQPLHENARYQALRRSM